MNAKYWHKGFGVWVFNIDSDWVAAKSKEEAQEFYRKNIESDDPDDLDCDLCNVNTTHRVCADNPEEGRETFADAIDTRLRNNWEMPAIISTTEW